MLKQILALTWKDLKVFFKDRGAVVMIFVQPFMFILVMSYALSGLYRTGERPIHILTVNQDKGTQAAAILHQMDEMKAFAYSMQDHRDVIKKTRAENWYSQDMFLRSSALKRSLIL